jgi:hypothetical protein
MPTMPRPISAKDAGSGAADRETSSTKVVASPRCDGKPERVTEVLPAFA